MKWNGAWAWLCVLLLSGSPAGHRQSRAAGRRVGSVVTATGRATAGGGSGARALLPWAEVSAGEVLRLEARARVVVVLDGGGRYVLEGPVGAEVQARSILRRDGAGRVRAERPLPAAPGGAGLRARSGRVVGTVLRATPDEFRFEPPSPVFGAANPPVTVAWTRDGGAPKQFVLLVRRGPTGRPLLVRTLPGTTRELELPAELPRGEWLWVEVAARGEERAPREATTWVRIATREEAAALEALAQRALGSPNDPELALVLVARQTALGFFAEAEVGLNRLQDVQAGGIAASREVLRRRLQEARSRWERTR